MLSLLVHVWWHLLLQKSINFEINQFQPLFKLCRVFFTFALLIIIFLNQTSILVCYKRLKITSKQWGPLCDLVTGLRVPRSRSLSQDRQQATKAAPAPRLWHCDCDIRDSKKGCRHLLDHQLKLCIITQSHTRLCNNLMLMYIVHCTLTLQSKGSQNLPKKVNL